MRSLAPIVMAIAVVTFHAATASGADYFVDPGGSDSAAGSSTAPWETIQMAASTAAAGDMVTVRDGDYAEVVSISSSGSGASSPITFVAENTHGAKCTGFVITGDFIVIDGFEVEADTSNYRGILVNASTGVVVRNCYVHDCPMGGIDVTYMAQDCEVIDNIIEHNGQWGIHVVASNVLVEGNEVTDTVQYHPKGEEPGFTGQDADGIRVFGDNHTVRSNYIHHIADPSDTVQNIDPHSDCIQTWDESSPTGRPVMTQTLIERNHCLVEHPSGKGVTMSAIYTDPCFDITIRNNVFEFRDEGIEASLGLFEDIFVYNNVFVARLNDSPWGTSMTMADVDGFEVYNNIIVDCHAEVRKIEGGTGEVDYNLVWYSDGSTPAGTPGAQANELWGVDPEFVTYEGVFGGNYHLVASSPAVDVGIALADVPDDFDGITRPQGSGYDMGAFEYHVGSDSDSDGDTDTDSDTDSDTDTDTDSDTDTDPIGGTDGDNGSCGCTVPGAPASGEKGLLGKIGDIVLAGLIGALCLTGCDSEPAAPADTGGAPFLGPSSRVVPDPTPNQPPPSHVPSPVFEPLAPAIPAQPQQPDHLEDEASRRRDAWLNEPFRCKAISTTKLRGCKFERHEGGYRLKFQVSDVVCEEVEFDVSGNPSRLTGCVGAWLRVPRNNTLKKAKRQDVWSGSHRGWKWKDGSKYCCPGLWLEPPKIIAR